MAEHLSQNGIPLESPRFEQRPPLRIAGLRARLGDPAVVAPALWQRFAPQVGQVTNALDRVGYGLCLRAADGEAGCFDYVAGCAVADFDGLPDDWARVSLPASRYAVFPHRQHVSKLQVTVGAIFAHGLRDVGCEAVPAGPDQVGFFERYGESFDPRTGSGDIEVWVPVKG